MVVFPIGVRRAWRPVIAAPDWVGHVGRMPALIRVEFVTSAERPIVGDLHLGKSLRPGGSETRARGLPRPVADHFAAAHASIHNYFNNDRHLSCRDIFKQNRSNALAEWRQLAA